MIYLTVDPGRSGTGWAVWNTLVPENFGLIHFGLISKGPPVSMLYQVKTIWGKYAPHRVLIEDVQNYGGSVKTIAAARKSDTIVLARFIGAICAICDSMSSAVGLVAPHEWKGQLNKVNTWDRCCELLPKLKDEDIAHHVHDAVALGFWLFKHINKNCKHEVVWGDW